MEVASGTAGLISLAALLLQGVKTLRTFCLDLNEVGTDIDDTAEDLNGLGTVIDQLQNIQDAPAAQPSTLTLLRRSITSCKDDVDKWLGALDGAKFEGKKGIRRLVKRVTGTLDFSRRSDLRQKIASHRSQLGLVLELLGRDADAQHLRQLDVLQNSQEQHFAQSMRCMQDGFGSLRLSQTSLESIEVRLQSMQKQLSQSVAQRKPVSSRRKRVNASRRSTTVVRTKQVEDTSSKELAPAFSAQKEQPQMLVRMVKTAFLVQEANGQPVVEMLAVADKTYDSANDATKISMVKYIQNLRLLVWLLRRDNLSTVASRYCANSEPPGAIVKLGSLNTGYKRLVVSSEFLRWRQFSLVQKLHSPLHGGSVPTDSTQIVHSYFMSNDYGRDLFQFYLSLPKAFDQEEIEKVTQPDSNDPKWVQARWQRMSLFTQYLDEKNELGGALKTRRHSRLGNMAATEPAPSCVEGWSVLAEPSNVFQPDLTRSIQSGDPDHDSSIMRRTSTFDSAIDLSHDVEMADVSDSDEPSVDSVLDGKIRQAVETASPVETSRSPLTDGYEQLRCSNVTDADRCSDFDLDRCEMMAAEQPLQELRTPPPLDPKRSLYQATDTASESHENTSKLRRYDNRAAQAKAAAKLRAKFNDKFGSREGYHKSSNTSPMAVSLDAYQYQLQLLEQQNKKRLQMACFEQSGSADGRSALSKSTSSTSDAGVDGQTHSSERLTSIGCYDLRGWRKDVTLEDRARYGAQLTQALREFRGSHGGSAFISDWDIWHKSTNTEADIYASASCKDEYLARTQESERHVRAQASIKGGPHSKHWSGSERDILEDLTARKTIDPDVHRTVSQSLTDAAEDQRQQQKTRAPGASLQPQAPMQFKAAHHLRDVLANRDSVQVNESSAANFRALNRDPTESPEDASEGPHQEPSTPLSPSEQTSFQRQSAYALWRSLSSDQHSQQRESQAQAMQRQARDPGVFKAGNMQMCQQQPARPPQDTQAFQAGIHQMQALQSQQRRLEPHQDPQVLQAKVQQMQEQQRQRISAQRRYQDFAQQTGLQQSAAQTLQQDLRSKHGPTLRLPEPQSDTGKQAPWARQRKDGRKADTHDNALTPRDIGAGSARAPHLDLSVPPGLAGNPDAESFKARPRMNSMFPTSQAIARRLRDDLRESPPRANSVNPPAPVPSLKVKSVAEMRARKAAEQQRQPPCADMTKVAAETLSRAFQTNKARNAQHATTAPENSTGDLPTAQDSHVASPPLPRAQSKGAVEQYSSQRLPSPNSAVNDLKNCPPDPFIQAKSAHAPYIALQTDEDVPLMQQVSESARRSVLKNKMLSMKAAQHVFDQLASQSSSSPDRPHPPLSAKSGGASDIEKREAVNVDAEQASHLLSMRGSKKVSNDVSDNFSLSPATSSNVKTSNIRRDNAMDAHVPYSKLQSGKADPVIGQANDRALNFLAKNQITQLKCARRVRRELASQPSISSDRPHPPSSAKSGGMSDSKIREASDNEAGKPFENMGVQGSQTLAIDMPGNSDFSPATALNVETSKVRRDDAIDAHTSYNKLQSGKEHPVTGQVSESRQNYIMKNKLAQMKCAQRMRSKLQAQPASNTSAEAKRKDVEKARKQEEEEAAEQARRETAELYRPAQTQKAPSGVDPDTVLASQSGASRDRPHPTSPAKSSGVSDTEMRDAETTQADLASENQRMYRSKQLPNDMSVDFDNLRAEVSNAIASETETDDAINTEIVGRMTDSQIWEAYCSMGHTAVAADALLEDLQNGNAPNVSQPSPGAVASSAPEAAPTARLPDARGNSEKKLRYDTLLPAQCYSAHDLHRELRSRIDACKD